MNKIILTVEVTDKDTDEIVEAAKILLPTWEISVKEITATKEE